ncbi:unnamed protein product, partial [Polarella glacialis]
MASMGPLFDFSLQLQAACTSIADSQLHAISQNRAGFESWLAEALDLGRASLSSPPRAVPACERPTVRLLRTAAPPTKPAGDTRPAQAKVLHSPPPRSPEQPQRERAAEKSPESPAKRPRTDCADASPEGCRQELKHLPLEQVGAAPSPCRATLKMKPVPSTPPPQGPPPSGFGMGSKPTITASSQDSAGPPSPKKRSRQEENEGTPVTPVKEAWASSTQVRPEVPVVASAISALPPPRIGLFASASAPAAAAPAIFAQPSNTEVTEALGASGAAAGHANEAPDEEEDEAESDGGSEGEGSGGSFRRGSQELHVHEGVPLHNLSAIFVLAVAVGDGHAVFVSRGGQAFAVGRNDRGQLGLCDHNVRCQPTMLPPLRAMQVAADDPGQDARGESSFPPAESQRSRQSGRSSSKPKVQPIRTDLSEFAIIAAACGSVHTLLLARPLKGGEQQVFICGAW